MECTLMKFNRKNCFKCSIRHDCAYFISLIDTGRIKMYPHEKGSVSERKHQAELYYDGYNKNAYNYT